MKNLWKLLFFLGIIFDPLFIFSQENDPGIWYNKITVPPSPNASSLGKFGECIVDKSTGIPDISIPLCDINEGGIDLNIAISYHAGGIKVQDEASCVGLGWSLNAGGVITRVMHGMPDDCGENGYIHHCSKVPRESWISHDLLPPGSTEFILTDGQLVTWEFLYQLSNGRIDYEPDVFYYNIGQHCGTFIFGNFGMPISLPMNDMSIEPIYCPIDLRKGISGFILRDANGIEYFFGNTDTIGFTETTIYTTSNDHLNHCVSSYYLNKICNPFRSTCISFKYVEYPYIRTSPVSLTQIYEHDPQNHIYYEKGNPVPSDITRIINMKVLSKIYFENDSITFKSSLSDEGLPEIDSIKFKDRTIKFDYGWFNSSTSGNYRLKLMRVIVADESNNEKVYKFSYSYDNTSFINLPNYDSYSVDHWGYYNGANNASLIPAIIIGNQTLGGNANRSPNSNYTKAGTIDTIFYPTGGWTQYDFENNTESRFPTIEEISRDSTLTFILENDGQQFEVNKDFIINLNPNFVYYDVQLYSHVTGDKCTCIDMGGDCYGGWYLTNVYNIGSGKNMPFYDANNNCSYVYNEDITYIFNEPPLTLNLSIESQDLAKITVIITFKYYYPADLLNKRPFTTGGLRINTLRNYDPISLKTNIRTFDYGQGGNLNAAEPFKYWATVMDTRIEDSVPVDFNQILTYSIAQAGFGLAPNIVSYDEVTEYLGSKSNNSGKIISDYYQIDDPFSSGPPFPPKISFQNLRSTLIKESFFSFINDTAYNPVRSVEYSYIRDLNEVAHIIGLQSFRKRTAPISNLKTDDFIYKNYLIDSYILKKNLITTTEYTTNGKYIKVDSLSYDSIHIFSPKKITSISSDGRLLKTVYNYPADYLNCHNTCKKEYEKDIDTCISIYGYCSREMQNCHTIYDSCRFAAYQFWLDYLNEWLKCKGLPSPFCNICEIEIQLAWNQRLNGLWACLFNSDYYNCLDSSDCQSIHCLEEVKSNYFNCQYNFDSCLIDQYNNANNENERAIIQLALLHNINALIEEEIYIDSIKVEHNKFNYRTKTLELADEDTTIVVDFPYIYSVDKANNSDVFYKEMRYDEYDSHFNIVQMTPKGFGPSKVFLWGYNHRLLIAEIDNATYSTVINALQILNLTEEDLQTKSDNALRTVFSQLRRLLPNSLITSYTHQPLIGINSKTDPNNITIYYCYDGLGRLQYVKDNEMNILKRMIYNYAY